jgi:hypothetical protein
MVRIAQILVGLLFQFQIYKDFYWPHHPATAVDDAGVTDFNR